MGLTIYKTICQENLLQDTQDNKLLKELIQKHSENRKFNAQGFFEEIRQLNGWATPSPGNEETALDYFDTTYEITTQDGKKAGLVIYNNEEQILVNVFAL